ncbi:uncharacterized protein LOC107633203 [Arachis ipaensis]|uniref:uncharacterized protein LOC107633203 n=1 Tax=Arachis ipaensis TaxID=130454 RepID=UPI0007AF958E|nr:uncharacterized protein LOC107633203 [Arachis ipaensis]XP_025640335.1 uncharacterized protein LOC112734997 [Arachis hypogaea]
MATIAEALTRLTLLPLTTQNAQQASTSSSLPSQSQPNPKGSINAITLRRGTKLDEIGVVPTSSSEETRKEEDEEEPLKTKEPKRKNPIEEPMPIPFSTLAKKVKMQEQLDPNMVEIFKNIEVTVPPFQAIQQVPKYARFLKDVCTHKEKIGELNKRAVDDSISSLIPKKCNDPGPCLVTCLIGGIKFTNCMCDLGACVSITPLPIYEKLNLSPLKRSGVRFVLANKSIVSVVGIAENVLVDIQGLLFLLNAHSGVYSFETDGKVARFTLEKSRKPILEAYSIFGCDIIEDEVIEVGKEQQEEKIAKKSNLRYHTQPKNAKELEIFLLGEVSSDQ